MDYTFGMYPHYRYPPGFVLPIVRDWALGRPRSFLADARSASKLLGDQLRYAGLENVPADGPLLVTHNHYARPGFGAWWLPLLSAAPLPHNPHLVMTGELTRWFQPWGGPISRFALPRIAKMYGFTTMPPMPPRPADVQARAESVRRVFRAVHDDPKLILILAPEGRDNLEGGALARPPEGAGRFLASLAERGLPVLPVAGWESDGALHIHFGATYILNVASGLTTAAKDSAARDMVMGRIAALLPAHLRGVYDTLAPHS